MNQYLDRNELAALLDLLREKGVRHYRVGALDIELGAGWDPPRDEPTQPDSPATPANVYEDPDLYLDGRVPHLGDE